MAQSCSVCGAELGDSERYCGNCGSATEKAVSTRGHAGDVAIIAASTAPAKLTQSVGAPVPISSLPSGVATNALPSQPSVANQQTVNVHTNIALVQKSSGPNLIVRGLWFIFLGWWLGYLAIALAYFLLIPIITIPLSIGIVNRLPQIMTLRPRTTSYKMTQNGDTLIVEESTLSQRPWWQRILYLIFVGWWAGAIWLSVAWAIGVLGIVTFGLTLPISFWMFNRAGAVTSLYRT